MVLIKLDSPGPIFFKQERSGRDNQVFTCIKFRTMKVNMKANEKQATREDKRITKLGAFLRKSNIDEMPQFFNVFLGNMSVVGPRPHMLKQTELYSELINNYLVRHYAKPGITGWAQVNGFRGETKELKDMKDRVDYDIWYIENWSFLLDLKIIYQTVSNVFRGDENAF
jgi:undecaprenyl-phosphate galactose phosphotransferase/putative colanic acid biosynthesis UDP-glucose lipid carrier transferase